MSSGRPALRGFLGYVVAAGSREHVQQQPLLELRMHSTATTLQWVGAGQKGNADTIKRTMTAACRISPDADLMEGRSTEKLRLVSFLVTVQRYSMQCSIGKHLGSCNPVESDCSNFSALQLAVMLQE